MKIYSPNNAEKGFVLVVVLWFTAVLSVMTVAFSLSARGGIKLIEAELKSAKERALLDAGIELAAVRIAMTNLKNRWRADGTQYRRSIDNIDLEFRMHDQSGRIDLNKSDKTLIFGLLKQFIASSQEAQKIADKIVEGRATKTSTISAKGGDRGRQKKTNSQTSTNPKYIDASQLQYETGISRVLYRQIRPFLTVHSDDGRINPRTAAPRILASIPFITRFRCRPDIAAT